MCGAPIEKGKEHHVSIEGSTLTVCNNCFSRIESRGGKKQQDTQQGTIKSKSAGYLQHSPMSRQVKQQPTRGAVSTNPTRSTVSQNMELVEDYAERIRRAREKLGWSQSILASRVKVSENIVKRIESGKLRPTLELARRLEEVLGIKLLMPSIEEELKQQKVQKYVTLGEIVNVKVDDK
ncbi:MAG: multiprotein bridging factor aMBF1 [Ignisphaera sp.]|uniref:TIGR00270 family protein n=1 Tax=Ignisphaera aggregans TaxID=334771 RepID=A0A7J3JNF0_9CREN